MAYKIHLNSSVNGTVCKQQPTDRDARTYMGIERRVMKHLQSPKSLYLSRFRWPIGVSVTRLVKCNEAYRIPSRLRSSNHCISYACSLLQLRNQIKMLLLLLIFSLFFLCILQFFVSYLCFTISFYILYFF